MSEICFRFITEGRKELLVAYKKEKASARYLSGSTGPWSPRSRLLREHMDTVKKVRAENRGTVTCNFDGHSFHEMMAEKNG